MNKNNILKGIMLTLSALIVGFIAISLPFKLFDELTSSQMTILFATEIIVYFLLGAIYLIAKDIKAQKVERKQIRAERKKAEIKQFQTEWLDLIA